MARGGHGLPKVSLWPALPYPVHPAGGVRPYSTILDAYAYARHQDLKYICKIWLLTWSIRHNHPVGRCFYAADMSNEELRAGDPGKDLRCLKVAGGPWKNTERFRQGSNVICIRPTARWFEIRWFWDKTELPNSEFITKRKFAVLLAASHRLVDRLGRKWPPIYCVVVLARPEKDKFCPKMNKVKTTSQWSEMCQFSRK